MNFLLLFFLSTLRNLDNIVLNGNGLGTTQLQIQQRYDYYSLCSVILRNDTQVITAMRRYIDVDKKIDVWDNHGFNWHLLISPAKFLDFQDFTRANRLRMSVIIPNVQTLIDMEQMDARRLWRKKFDWTRYHTLDEINIWLDATIAAYPNVTKALNFGNSYEGRKVQGIKISYKKGNPGIFIESNIHAREWITSATATWIINELLTSKEKSIRYLAENYDWYIVPVLNVDGFVYSHEKDRLWRKTRRPSQINTNCVGVDGNRNFDYHWMENGGAGSDPCDETYAGPYPFSEPEIRNLASYIRSIKNRINILLAFHSYSQKLLSPFGYTDSKRPDNFGDLMKVANAFAEAVLALPYRTHYEAGSTADLLYIATGDTADWAYGQGIHLTYTIEFRDEGQYGFLLPARYIIPNSREALAGILAMVTEAENLGYMKLKYRI